MSGSIPGFSYEPLDSGVLGSMWIEDSKNRDDPNQEEREVQVGGGYSGAQEEALGSGLGLPQEA